MNIYLFVVIIVAPVIIAEIIFRFLHYRREERLLNRLMAKDYREYRYYEKEHTKDVEEKEAIRDEAREERDEFRKETKLDEEIKRAGEQDADAPKIEDFEEEWEKEEK